VNTFAPAWAGLEIRRCPALRRTHLVVYGSVDEQRVAEVQAAVATAFAEGHKVTYDLHNLTLVERSSIEALLDLAEESSQP
jgi:anti-anti-sigma regulatory factor